MTRLISRFVIDLWTFVISSQSAYAERVSWIAGVCSNDLWCLSGLCHLKFGARTLENQKLQSRIDLTGVSWRQQSQRAGTSDSDSLLRLPMLCWIVRIWIGSEVVYRGWTGIFWMFRGIHIYMALVQQALLPWCRMWFRRSNNPCGALYIALSMSEHNKILRQFT
jgi:hypothetical protein